jgi:hypothetical protein
MKVRIWPSAVRTIMLWTLVIAGAAYTGIRQHQFNLCYSAEQRDGNLYACEDYEPIALDFHQALTGHIPNPDYPEDEP